MPKVFRDRGWFATGDETPELFAGDGIIQQVGPTVELPQTADSVLDLSWQTVLSGLVNTHHHLNQSCLEIYLPLRITTLRLKKNAER
jgi:cytosine/adenosine deaminase-related metal-dependent hydrolase